MKRRKKNDGKKEERKKIMVKSMDRQEKEYGEKKTKEKYILYY